MLRPSVRMAQFGRKRVTASGYSCTVTVGNYSSALFGYEKAPGTYGGFGSINVEPIAGQTLALCYCNHWTLFSVAFVGDISATLAGLHVWWDGVDYGIGDVTTRWDFDDTYTVWSISTGLPTFVNASTKLLEIK